MDHQSLKDLIGSPVLAVLGTYSSVGDDMAIYICGVDILSDTQLKVYFPKGHTLNEQQRVTLHLDNRTGIAEYDADLAVNRLSFKGQVVRCSEHGAIINAIEYQVYYGLAVMKAFHLAGYEYPKDERQSRPLPLSPLASVPKIDAEEHDNKIGVLLTFAQGQPHTTVMAFLSTIEDDIFFITFPSTFKGQLLSRNNRCYFAIDSRATFSFEYAIEWNYSIICGDVYEVPKGSPVFRQVQELFIAKNPWEMGFFSAPEVQMYHLKAEHVVCPQRG